MKSVLLGTSSVAPSPTVVNFVYANSFRVSTGFSNNEANRLDVIPVATTIDNLIVTLSSAPGASTSFTFTVRKNQIDTTLSVVISGASTTGTLKGNPISYVAGDTISISCTPNNTPTAPSTTNWSLQASTSSNIQPILGGNSSTVSTGAASYNNINGGTNVAWDATEANVQSIVPAAGTFSNLFIKLSSAPGGAASYTFTIEVNGADSSVSTGAIAGASTTGNDTLHSVSVVPGDKVSLKALPANGPASKTISWGATFTPTSGTNCIMLFGSSTLANTSALNFDTIGGLGGNWNATESTRQSIAPDMQFLNMYALVGTAPGAGGSGKKWSFFLRQNSVASNLSVVIAETATTGNTTATVVVSSGQFINFMSSGTLTPAAVTGGIHIGMTYIIPDSGGLLLMGVGS